MNIILNYNQYTFESFKSINESLITNCDELLDSIDAKELNIFDIFKLNRDNYVGFIKIENFYNNNEFNENLKKLKLKKGKLESTVDSETFIEKTIDLKFFLIHNENDSDLNQPKYLIIQWRNKGEKWSGVKSYKVGNQIRILFDKISNKTIEFEKDDDKYIYITSNGGNDYVLQKNSETEENKIFKQTLSNDDVKNILLDKTIKINIID